jgi:hypothetical protein
MARVPLSSDLSTRITERIEAFQHRNESEDWLAKRLKEVDALPLVLDMGGSYAIRASGDLVEFAWDGPGDAMPLGDPRLINAALYQGSLKHPQLACLVPSRPVSARDCVPCDGTGRPSVATQPGLENVICYCGGVGWLPLRSCES